MTPNKESAIIVLNRTSCDYYRHGVTSVQTLNLDTVIKDMDVVDQSELEKQIKVFVESNKINPANLTVIVTEPCTFTQTFPKTPTPTTVDIQKFLDTVPFEVVGHVKLSDIKDDVVIAVNSKLIQGLAHGFTLVGFAVFQAFPIQIFGMPNVNNTIDYQTIGVIESKIESMKQYNVLVSQDQKPPTQLKKTADSLGVKKSARLFALVGVFVVLLLILFLVIRQSQSPPPVVNTNTPQGNVPLPYLR